MDLRALKDEANRLYAKGKFHKAMDAYWNLIALDATDAALRMRHAEASRRAELKGRAVASYRVAAELFAQTGHVNRAIAALKMAQQLNPDDPLIGRVLKQFVRAAKDKGPRPSPPQQLSLPAPRKELPMRAERHRVRERDITVEIEMPKVEVTLEPTSAPQLRRLSANAVAFRPSSSAAWVVMRSDSPISATAIDGDATLGLSAEEPLSDAELEKLYVS